MRKNSETLSVTIRSDLPPPAPGRKVSESELGTLRQIFEAMKPGDSFEWPSNKQVYRAANEVKAKVRTRKLNGTGYRVWRIS